MGEVVGGNSDRPPVQRLHLRKQDSMASSSRQNFGVWAEARNTLRDREQLHKQLLRKRREEENANRGPPKNIYHVSLGIICRRRSLGACIAFLWLLLFLTWWDNMTGNSTPGREGQTYQERERAQGSGGRTQPCPMPCGSIDSD